MWRSVFVNCVICARNTIDRLCCRVWTWAGSVCDQNIKLFSVFQVRRACAENLKTTEKSFIFWSQTRPRMFKRHSNMFLSKHFSHFLFKYCIKCSYFQQNTRGYFCFECGTCQSNLASAHCCLQNTSAVGQSDQIWCVLMNIQMRQAEASLWTLLQHVSLIWASMGGILLKY